MERYVLLYKDIIEFVRRAVMLLMVCRIPRKLWLPKLDIVDGFLQKQ